MSANIERPAILGGVPTFVGGPPSWPIPDTDIEEALRESYRSGTWGYYCGPKYDELEALLKSTFQAESVFTCASGTLGIEIALRSVGVTSGDEVILAGYEYEPNFLTVHQLGAMPVLVDILESNACVNLEKVVESITPKTKAILATHLHGGLVDMPRLKEIASTYKIPLIEDFCQSVGGLINGKPCGSFGDLSVLSFGGSKSLSAGRGGAVLVNNPDYAQRCKLVLNRGVQQWASISELQAVVLIPQLQKLTERTETRWHAVQKLGASLEGIPGLQLFEQRDNDIPAFYKVGFWFDETQFGLTREQFLKATRAEGIAFNEGFRALHIGRSSKRYKSVNRLSVCEKASREVVMLHHPVLLSGDDAVAKVGEGIRLVWERRGEMPSFPSPLVGEGHG